MRLDLVLKQTCLIKRRTVAKTIVENGKVSINGKVAKPSTDVRDGDILLLKLGPREIEVKITYIKKYNKDFPTYEELSTKKVNVDA